MDLGDNELTLTPIPGKSGKAYMGSYPDGKRVFVKMNTSPILPGLAREQIAPQLLWTRRLPDGRDMCAQEWQADHQYLEPPSPLASLDEAVEPFGIYHGNTS